MSVEKGPSPATEIPWDASTFPDTYPEINSGLHRVATEIATVDDCRAIVHRVNHWDELIVERDALAARVVNLEQAFDGLWKLVSDSKDDYDKDLAETEQERDALAARVAEYERQDAEARTLAGCEDEALNEGEAPQAT